MGKLTLLSLVVATLFVAQAVYWAIRLLGERRHQEMRRRLRQLGNEDARARPLLRSERFADSELVHRLLKNSGLFDGLQRLLAQTDLEWSVGRLVGISLGIAITGFLAGLIFMKSAVAGVLFGVLGASVPALWALSAKSRRENEISKQLPEALDLMVRSLRAGHAMPVAIKLAAQELPMPIATEFGRAWEEQGLGMSVEQSVLHMTERVPGNMDLRIFAVSLVIQRQVGGNIAENLERIAGVIRERYKFYGHLRALTAEGRMSGIILGALPWVVLFAIWVLRREYLAEFWAAPLGKVMSACALSLWIAGIIWMSRIVKVDP